jgi:hypothetical protein
MVRVARHGKKQVERPVSSSLACNHAQAGAMPPPSKRTS